MQKPEEHKEKGKIIYDTHAVLERCPSADSWHMILFARLLVWQQTTF
jgi:hypothetical protein